MPAQSPRAATPDEPHTDAQPAGAPDLHQSEEETFQALTHAASDAAQRAYAPYSGYPVGAAALTEDGRLITGCNVENASYGVGLCAECTLVGQLRMSGGGKLAAFTCVNAEGQTITPCGRCRQLLHEFAGAKFRIKTPLGITGIDEILPQAFGPENLKEVSSA